MNIALTNLPRLHLVLVLISCLYHCLLHIESKYGSQHIKIMIELHVEMTTMGNVIVT